MNEQFIEVGMRREVAAQTARALARDYPEEMRDHLAPHMAEFCIRLMAGVRMMDRSCLRLYADIMRRVGEGHTFNVLVAMWPKLGVKDEDEAKSLIQTARQLTDRPDSELERIALDWIRERAMTEPEFKSQVLEACGVRAAGEVS